MRLINNFASKDLSFKWIQKKVETSNKCRNAYPNSHYSFLRPVFNFVHYMHLFARPLWKTNRHTHLSNCLCLVPPLIYCNHPCFIIHILHSNCFHPNSGLTHSNSITTPTPPLLLLTDDKKIKSHTRQYSTNPLAKHSNSPQIPAFPTHQTFFCTYLRLLPAHLQHRLGCCNDVTLPLVSARNLTCLLTFKSLLSHW